MSNPWLIKLNPEISESKIRLVCFPFAGGGTVNYVRWKVDLDPQIELYGINLPGRERFFGEPCLTSYQHLISNLAQSIAALPQCPLIFFGHSFGGLTAYFTALELAQKNNIHINHVFISARTPLLMEQKLSHLNNEEFKQTLIERYQGIPKDILNNPEILNLFLNIIRQDFKMYEQYPDLFATYNNNPISAHITSLGFSTDIIKQDNFLKWKDYTLGHYCHKELPGGHFEIINNWKTIVEDINSIAFQINKIDL